MSNKHGTPPKGMRPYLQLLHSSKRKSMFSRQRTPTTSKTRKISKASTSSFSQPRTYTQPSEPVSLNAFVSLIRESHNDKIKASQDNMYLKKENLFLREELHRLRKDLALNREQEEFSVLRERNAAIQEKFARARRQLKEMRKGYERCTLGELQQMLHGEDD